jgi:hypothetical protein
MTRFQTAMASMKNVSPDQDPHLELPLRVVIPFTIICAIYCCFRVYILIKDDAGLRSMTASAYQNVEWSQYFPHI